MKKSAKVIVTSAMTMAMCASLIAGGTLALFTAQSDVNIVITSGNLDVKASVTEMWTATSTKDENYEWKSANKAGEVFEGNFGDDNLGVAKYEAGKLSLEQLVPGEAVKFTLSIANDSTVAIKYQIRTQATSDRGGLFQYLKFEFDGDEMTKTASTAMPSSTTYGTLAPSDKTKDAKIVISLPYNVGNEAQNLSCELMISVLAIQGNANFDEVPAEQLPDSEGSATVPEGNQSPVELETNNHLVKVTVPAEDIETGKNLTLEVKRADEAEAKFGITVAEGTAFYYDISVDGAKVTAESGQPFTVKIYVGKGLKTVQVYHWNETEEKKDYIKVTDYDEDGFITFKTESFSPFAIVAYDSIVPDVAPEATAAAKTEAVQKALEKAKDEDIVFLPAGEYALDGLSDNNGALKVGEGVTLRGEAGTTFTSSADGRGKIVLAAEGATVENLTFTTSKNSNTDFAFLSVTSSNVVIKNCTFEGKYNPGEGVYASKDDEVSRAIVMNAGSTGYLIEGNTFKNLRQAAYLEGGGTVKNNTLTETRGFIATCDYKVTFEGNVFNNNPEEIAIIKNVEAKNIYNITDALKISQDNYGALVDLQVLGVKVRGTTIEATGFEPNGITPSAAFVNALTYVNGLENNTTPLTIELLGEDTTYEASANGQFVLNANNVHIVGAGAANTTIDGKETNVDGYGAFVLGGNNCSLEGVTVKTASTDANVAALKVGSTMSSPADSDTINVLENVTLRNLVIEGNLGHGLNMHGVKGATVENITINKYGKCGISFAMATEVRLANVTTTQKGGWADIGFMYGTKDASKPDNTYAYKTHSDVTVDFASCTFQNGAIYSERPAENDGDDLTDIIRNIDGTQITNGMSVTDALGTEAGAESALVMTVAPAESKDKEDKDIAGTWALSRQATFNAANEKTFGDALGFANSTSGQVTVNGSGEVDTEKASDMPEDGNGGKDWGMNVDANADLIIDGGESGMSIEIGHTAFNNPSVGKLEGISSGKIVFKNVDFKAKAQGCGYVMTLAPGFTGEIVFENCTFEGLYCAVYFNDGTSEAGNVKLTFTGCTFTKVTHVYGYNYSTSEDKINVEYYDAEGNTLAFEDAEYDVMSEHNDPSKQGD